MFDYVKEGYRSISPCCVDNFSVTNIGALKKVNLVEPSVISNSISINSKDKVPGLNDLLSRRSFKHVLLSF